MYREDTTDDGGMPGGPNEPPGEAPPGMEWRWTGTEWVTVPAAVATTPEPEPIAPIGEPPAPVNPYTGEAEVREPGAYTPTDPYVAPVNPFDPNTAPFSPGTTWATGPFAGGSDQWVVTPPAPSSPTGPGPVAGGGGTEQAPNMFPVFTGPAYEAPPQFQAPPAFSYDKFMAPTLEQAQGEPGYDFAFREGLRAVQNAKAARGALRTGGTLKDLVQWGSGLAEQNYQNVYNRQADTWARNQKNAADTYVTNYGVGRDVWDRNAALTDTSYDRNYKSAWDTYSSGTEGQKLTLDDLYRRWFANLNVNKELALAPIPGEVG